MNDMTNLTWSEIEALVRNAFDTAGMKPTEYGIRQATLECAELNELDGRSIEDQMNYIITQAIPDGFNEGWIENDAATAPGVRYGRLQK